MAVLDPNGVPILDPEHGSDGHLSPPSLQLIQDLHQPYVETGDGEHLLTGAVAWIHNPHPITGTAADVTRFVVGGETIDEALKSIIGAHDTFYAFPPGTPYIADRPEWVDATDEQLASLLAEHYGCPAHQPEDLA